MKKLISVAAFLVLGLVAYWAPSALADSPAVGWSTGGGGGSSVTLPVTAGNGGTGSSTNTGTSGTLLRGDGDSYESTTFTIPATIASGTIFRASSANVLAATAYTLPAAAGTSGNVLTSDGTNFVSSAPAAGGGGGVDVSTTKLRMHKAFNLANTTATTYTQVGVNTTVTITDSDNTAATRHDSVGGHPQTLSLSSANSVDADAGITTSADIFRNQSGGGAKIWFQVQSLDNTGTGRHIIGVSAVPATSKAANDATVHHAIFRRVAGTDSNWKTITNDNSGGGQIVDTGVAVNNNPRTFCIDMTTNTAIKFYIDGVLVSTHDATNAPALDTAFGLVINTRRLTGPGNEVMYIGSTRIEHY